MNTFTYLIIILILLLVLFYAVEKWELKQFKITDYTLRSEKISAPIQVSVVADLHDHIYGTKNQPLFDALRSTKPDLILIPGDLFTERKVTDTTKALDFLKEAVKIAPVYYSNGNHETRLQRTEEGLAIWEKYREEAECLGVHFVNNCTEAATAAGQQVLISGYECDMRLYAKGKNHQPKPGEVTASIQGITIEKNQNTQEKIQNTQEKIQNTQEKVQKNDEDSQKQQTIRSADHFHILLAHNPIFFEEYRKTGADLTVSGHMHGGLVRIPGIGSVISPQFKLFPKYDAGLFTEEGKHLVISKGLGTHTFNIRVFNRAEIVKIRIEGKEG